MKKQPDIEKYVKEGPHSEEHPETSHVERKPFSLRSCIGDPSNGVHLQTFLEQHASNALDSLVTDQVIDDRYVNLFQNTQKSQRYVYLSSANAMPDVQEKYDITALNSFGVKAHARYYASISTVEELASITPSLSGPDAGSDLLILGEGNNILFTGDHEGTILRPLIRGIEILEENKDEVLVAVGAGENWDEWVLKATSSGWYGLENLSLIPGSVGAAPIQNIGAYGVELEQHFEFLDAWDLSRQELRRFDRKACGFAYRDSFFKSTPGRSFVITRVAFRLKKEPGLCLEYGPVRKEYENAGGKTAMDLREVIIRIRQSKLPETDTHGNAGSFFKNPVIDAARLAGIPKEFGTPPSYPLDDGRMKVPAAWLIDKCGWKGKRRGAIGSWHLQALVLVNYGGASGQQIYDFSESLIRDVEQKTGIRLEREVRVIG